MVRHGRVNGELHIVVRGFSDTMRTPKQHYGTYINLSTGLIRMGMAPGAQFLHQLWQLQKHQNSLFVVRAWTMCMGICIGMHLEQLELILGGATCDRPAAAVLK